MRIAQTDQPLRRAFVTGASTGIGEEIAVRLARAGYELALAGRNLERLASVKENIENLGSRSCVVRLDLCDAGQVVSAIDKAWSLLGPCDLLVNCGGSTLRKEAIAVTSQDWDEIMNTNLRSAFFAATRFAKRLIEEGRPGSVVNIGSTHGLVGFAGVSAYGISKSGLHHLTRMLALEWAEYGIRVNAVAPGTTETPSRREVLQNPERRKAMLERIPTRRFTTVQEVAAAAVYLSSEEAASVTGHVLVLDGGLTTY